VAGEALERSQREKILEREKIDFYPAAYII
jgi:hypothetical protein